MSQFATDSRALPTQPFGPTDTTSPRANVARSSFYLLSGQVATTVLSIILNAQLGRTLGPSEFGVYFFLFTSTIFVHVFGEWGIGAILVRDIARHPERTPPLLGSALAIRLLLPIPGALVGASIVRLLGYEIRTQWMMALMTIAFIPTSLLAVFGCAYRGIERMDVDARATVINKALHVLMVTVGFAMGGRILTVILSLGAAGSLALAYTAAQAKKIGFRRPVVDPPSVRYLMREGSPLLAMEVLTHARLYIETLILTALVPAAMIGSYGASRTIWNTLVMPAAIVLSAFYPRLSRAAANPVELRQEVASSIRPVLTLAVLVATGTALFADVAISVVYGSSGYAPAISILQLSAPSLFLLFINMLLGAVAVIVNRARVLALFRFAMMAVGAALSLFLVPVAQEEWGNGALGAVLSTTLCEFLILVGFFWIAPKGLMQSRVLRDLLRSIVSAGLAAASVLLLPVGSPLLGIPVFLASFAGCAVVTGLVARDDFNSLWGALVGRFRRSQG